MPYTPAITIKVEALDAAFYIGVSDANMAKLLSAFTSAGVAEIGPDSATVLPEDLMLLLAQTFVQDCKDWDGVQKADGSKLECSKVNKQAIPLLDKVAVMVDYLSQAGEALTKKVPAPATPTTS